MLAVGPAAVGISGCGITDIVAGESFCFTFIIRSGYDAGSCLDAFVDDRTVEDLMPTVHHVEFRGESLEVLEVFEVDVYGKRMIEFDKGIAIAGIAAEAEPGLVVYQDDRPPGMTADLNHFDPATAEIKDISFDDRVDLYRVCARKVFIAF